MALPIKRIRERSAEEVAARKAKKQNKRAEVAKNITTTRPAQEESTRMTTISVEDLSSAVQKARLASHVHAPREAALVQQLAHRVAGGREMRIAALCYSRARRGKPWPLPLRSMQRAAALDSLHWELWGSLSNGENHEPGKHILSKGLVEHPTVIAEKAACAALSQPGARETLQQALKSIGVVGKRWGIRKAWLDGRSQKLWRPGASALLRLLRARWCEAACQIGGVCADSHTRAALLKWQFAGRDGAARWLSFAVPSARVLKALKSFVGDGGLVELGAHNGYWADRLAARGINVMALDIAPPRHITTVVRGTAESLKSISHGTLLLCMPPPGEPGCAEDALEAFRGDRVAYIGEWGTGMTATNKFHQKLLQDFTLEQQIPLPCWALTRVDLFLFRKRARHANHRDAETPPMTCDVCGISDVRLVQCPWTRQFRVCGNSCYVASHSAHQTVLKVAFCGVNLQERPSLSSWLPCAWLEHGVASEKHWDGLREATPQAEIGPGSGAVHRRE